MKMMWIRTPSVLVPLSLLILTACSALNREPRTDPEPVAPSQVSDFGTLYAQNCAACHGAEGRGGASFALANPVYLAIVDETTMQNIVANGVRGTSMPAFAQRAGGMLTEQQIEVIANGIFYHWARKEVLAGASPPHMRQKPPGTLITGNCQPMEKL
jgi:mono/diheme cytochrome c family protein